MSFLRAICLPVVIAALSLQAWAANSTVKSVTVDYRTFPGLARMDGNWSALLAGSDGKVYIGLAYHGGGGHLVYYDSKNNTVHDVGDLNVLTGQQFMRVGPQSKIHTKFGEGKDGRIYFATEYGLDFDFPRYATPEWYPGGHWMDFNPKTGQVTDLGIAFRYQGIITGRYDPVYNRYYGIRDPHGEFVYYDISKHTERNLGRFYNWESLCRTLVADDRGDIYGSFGTGQIFKYDPRTDTLKELAVKLPIRQKGISLGRDYTKSSTAWRVAVWDEHTKKIYGVEESATTLFSFDPNAGEDGVVKRLGQLCIPSFKNARDLPYATLSLTLGHDRKLYYAAAGREFDYSGSHAVAASHLMTYDLNTGRIDDLGEMHLPDGRRVIGTNSATTGPDGTIYFGGAIEVRPQPGKPVEAGGKIANVYYRLAIIIYHPGS
ncbi:MAG TPA: hypothetical protein VFL79_10540 [Terriglobia bacterium]|nr:hypothetical protein [Terriglobia bacterium]